jgi:hypothetical protein
MPKTRLIFFALLLANVAFFAWRENAGPPPGHEPQRLQQQIDPDKVRVLLPQQAAADPPAAAKVADAAAAVASPATEVPALLCKAFSGIPVESAKAAQSAVADSAPNAQVVLVTSKESSSYWVHIPPQPNKAGAEKKVAELREMGVSETFIISDDGPSKWAVSLGLFKSREMADNYLQKLIKQGVRSAKIEVRDKNADKVRLEISAPAETLGALAREIKPLANASIGECRQSEAVKN